MTKGLLEQLMERSRQSDSSSNNQEDTSTSSKTSKEGESKDWLEAMGSDIMEPNTLPDFGNDSDASSEESLSFTEMNRCAIEMLRLGMGPGDIQGGASNMVDTLWGGPNHEEAQRRLHNILLPPWCAEEQGHIAEAQKSLNFVFAQRELMIGQQPLTVEASVLAEHKAAMERIIAHYEEPWERAEGHAKGMALKQRSKVLVKMAWAAKLGCVELLKVPEWKDGKVGSSSVKRARYED